MLAKLSPPCYQLNQVYGHPPKSRRDGRFKLRLTRLLFSKGYLQAEIRSLYDILDWMLHLGKEQEIIYTQEVLALREEPNMSTYVNTLESYFTQQGIQQGRQLGLQEGERIGLQQGKQLGAHQGAERVLRSQLMRRFGELPSWASAKLEAASAETIESWSLQLLDAHSLDEVFA